jgi:cellulose 1,4-beta-cellobiosidase
MITHRSLAVLLLTVSASAGAAPRLASSPSGARAATPRAPDGGNPFVGARFYVDPDFARRVEEVAVRTPAEATRLRKLKKHSTALWVDSIAKTSKVASWLDDALAQEKAAGAPVVPLFVVYDLPNRDCSAESSAGELRVDAGGEARYQHDYIDVIAAQFKARPTQRIAVVLEPDSLANMVTNLAVDRCAVADRVYRRGIAYAISKLSLPNVHIYLDAGHSQWLGWPRNLPKSVAIYKQVLAAAGGADRIRGFAINVSNYNPIKDPVTVRTTPDEPSPDERAYVAELSAALEKAGISGKRFLIDTSRNGRANLRTAAGNWCNIKGAGLGERPRAAPEALVDAYVWVKPPGDSDGTSDRTAARFDENCASDDAAPNAPEAGKLFEPYLLDLVKNANPPL